jgi:hypothetical protein
MPVERVPRASPTAPRESRILATTVYCDADSTNSPLASLPSHAIVAWGHVPLNDLKGMAPGS